MKEILFEKINQGIQSLGDYQPIRDWIAGEVAQYASEETSLTKSHAFIHGGSALGTIDLIEKGIEPNPLRAYALVRSDMNDSAQKLCNDYVLTMAGVGVNKLTKLLENIHFLNPSIRDATVTTMVFGLVYLHDLLISMPIKGDGKPW